jgi:hypothetical protein
LSALQRITERVWRNGDPNAPQTARPMLRLDEFFQGNDVVGSIGCNLDGSPHPSEIWRALQNIEAVDGVDSVYVLVTLFDVPEWPFSDAVRIVTSHDVDTVRSWFPVNLAPDEMWEEEEQGVDQEPIRVPPGMKIIGAWWD